MKKVDSKQIIVGLSCIVVLFITAYFTMYHRMTDRALTVCSNEAKLCPDGTSVGRIGPKCEFAPCTTIQCPDGTYIQEGACAGEARISPNDSNLATQSTWNIVDRGEDPKSHANTQDISVTVNGKKYKVGVFEGGCVVDSESNFDELAGEFISGVRCWFGGHGSNIVLVRHNGLLFVKKQEVDEGSAEFSPPAGKFITMFMVD